MKKYIISILVLIIITSVLLSACNAAISGAISSMPVNVVSSIVKSSAPTQVPTPTPNSNPGSLGPTSFPQGVNPLTGLLVAVPSNLALVPALVSISTFPESARPEAGLSFASWVFEAYIGEGMTRYLSVYYGNLPQITSADDPSLVQPSIGPIRSGRLWYGDARKLFSGFIVMASASANVAANLGSYTSIFGSDEGNINSALMPIDQLKKLAENNKAGLLQGALSGNAFTINAPENGKLAESIWVRWSFLNQIFWKYDPASGSYNRYQNGTTEGTSQVFTKSTDRLNGDPLTIENVVILFANYQIKKNTNIGIELLDVTRPAMLFRDGKMYSIRWTTTNDEFAQKSGLRHPIRFIDSDGNPFPLKPGQVWLEIVPMYTPYYETVDSSDILQMLRNQTPGSGHWAVVFYTPPNIQ